MIFADTHTHLYLEEFDSDRDAMMQRAEQAGVLHLLLPNIDSTSVKALHNTVASWPHLCHPMMGLHPTSVRADYRRELDIVEQHLASGEVGYCAIGETGIDLYWDKTHAAEQEMAFGYQLDLALKYDLPVVIHTRNSMEETLQILEQRADAQLRGVFHCYSGSAEQAVRAVELGFMLGIGGVVTYKNSSLQKVVEGISPEHLLLETDAPFLPPVPHRGQRNEPAYIPIIARKISEIKNIPLEEVAEITTRNARKIFDF
jgi:TatD DNase family protein